MADKTGLTHPLHALLGLAPEAMPEPGRYVVLKKLGAGGMGSVFLARDQKLGREVAIKVVLDTAAEVAADALNRFYREARCVAALSHSGIIRVYDYSGPSIATPYIVMERLHGVSLQSLIDTSPIPERICVAILHELARALAHAHGAGVLHRDIKPDNIFIEPDGRLVLMDFGLAKGLLVESDRRTLLQGKTRLVGTPAFSSPEQINASSTLTASSDLFALGATLYYALTQVFPFRGDTIFEVMREVMTADPLPLKDLVEVTPELEALIAALLKKGISQRPADASAVLAALQPLLALHGLRVPAEEIARWLRGEAAAPATSPSAHKEVKPEAEPTNAETVVTTTEEVAMIATVTQVQRHLKTQSSSPPGRSKLLIVAGVAALVATASVALVLARPRPPPTSTIEPSARETVAPQTQPAVEEQAALPVKLRVSVTPWGKVTIDGRLMGTTPSFSQTELAVGPHEVEVSHPKFGVRKERIVLPTGEQVVELEIDLTQQ